MNNTFYLKGRRIPVCRKRLMQIVGGDACIKPLQFYLKVKITIFRLFEVLEAGLIFILLFDTYCLISLHVNFTFAFGLSLQYISR